MNAELKKAIDQISKDKGLDRAMLIETLEEAVRTSVERRFSEDMEVEVSYNDDTGDIEVYQYKTVVRDGDVGDEDREIEYCEACKHDPEIQIDDQIGFRVKIEDLGRIAAQSAKQVIIQRMRDAEQALIYEDFKERIGEIVSGSIQRRDKNGWIVNLGRTEAILGRDQQIGKERYKRGDNVQAIIIEVRRESRGPQVLLSRSHRDYLAALFRREVPEVDDGVIQILGVARDPGSRSKVAVFSKERDVDPVGACVGVRGARIQNIVQELRGERVDIVVWNANISTYAKNALAPALVTRVIANEEEGLLEIIVPDDQLTNAIGRKGQNVKLASKLLGWRLDIYTESRFKENSKIGHGLEQVANMSEVPIDRILDAGYTSLKMLRQASDAELSDKLILAPQQLQSLRSALAVLSQVVEQEPEDSSLAFSRPLGEEEAEEEEVVEEEVVEEEEAAAPEEEYVVVEEEVTGDVPPDENQEYEEAGPQGLETQDEDEEPAQDKE